MMKKVAITLLILSMAVVANAGLYITVDGVVNPPDSTITISPSTWIVLGVWDDGQTNPGTLALGLTNGLASLGASNVVVSDGVTAMMADDALMAESLGVQNPFISMEVTNSSGGILVREIDFHCDGPGDVGIAIVDENGLVQDTQVIHQVPEPMTMALLGLGGLFLRRRIA